MCQHWPSVGQARLRTEVRIASIAPSVMLAIFRFSAPGLVAPTYATASGGLTILLAGLISIVSYVLVMRTGNRPLQIVESVFVGTEAGQGTSDAGQQPAHALLIGAVERETLDTV